MKTTVAGGEKSVQTFQSPWTQVMKCDTPRNRLDTGQVNQASETLHMTSVPDPPDPHFFRRPGNGSISQRYGSGSGYFYHQPKIVRKTLIPSVLWLLLVFLSLKNYVNVPSKSNRWRKFFQETSYLLASWRSMTKIAGFGSESVSGSIIQSHGFADPDPDPHQNVMDPEHCRRP